MKLKSLKIGYIVLVFLLLLVGLANTVWAATTLTPASGSISPDALQGVAYTSTTTIVASGGTVSHGQQYRWSSSGLPANLTYTISGFYGETCTITGTSLSLGTKVPFTITAQDKNNVSATRTYTITINPAAGCAFVGSSSGVIDFGNIDPTTAGPLIGSVTSPQFTCTAGTACTISVNPASGWQLTSGPNTIGYTLGVVPSGTYGATAVNVFPAAGSSMSQAQYGNALAGTYSNSSAVTVTINFIGGPITASLPIGSLSGTVPNECSVTGSPSLTFGTLDAVANAGGATATVTSSSIMCTMGGSVAVTSDGGLNYSGTPRLKDASTNYINYNIGYSSPLIGAGGTTNIGGSGAGHLALGATIPANALDNAPAGTYNDTITLTISY